MARRSYAKRFNVFGHATDSSGSGKVGGNDANASLQTSRSDYSHPAPQDNLNENSSNGDGLNNSWESSQPNSSTEQGNGIDLNTDGSESSYKPPPDSA